jgi:hypothetical protein
VPINAADYRDAAESGRCLDSLDPQKFVNDLRVSPADQLLSREDTAARGCHLAVPEREPPL